MPLPDHAARRAILKLLTDKMPVETEGLQSCLERATSLTNGLSAAELSNVCQEAALQVLRSDINAVSIPHSVIEHQCEVYRLRTQVITQHVQ